MSITMKKLITILLIGILIAGCSKEPTPTPEPLTYDYTGRVYAKTPKEGGLWTVYEFYSSDSASYTLRRDNWDGAVLGNVCKRGYTIGYVNEAPAITVKDYGIIEDTMVFHYQILDGNRFEGLRQDEDLNYYLDGEIFERVR